MSVADPLPDRDLLKVVRSDSRYAYGAYEFVFEALGYTQHLSGRDAEDLSQAQKHVSGQQLLDGIRRLALEQFGLMTLSVFHQWGIHATADFGEIVFNLVEGDLLKKTPEDRREDFHNAFGFEEAFRTCYRIPIERDVP